MRFLANRDAHLHFALLTDYLDAPAQTLPGDEALLAHARECIEALNRRYTEAGESCASATASSCSTARVAGTPPIASGWATSASAASWAT